MMKFIKIDFPPELFLPRSESTGGFIADVLPEEKMEIVGYFQSPMYWYEKNKNYENNESQGKDKSCVRVLKK